MKKESYVHGQFCWVDLQTTDTGAAKRFYGELLGWDFHDVPTDKGPVYTMFLKNGLAAAGMGPLPPDMKAAGAPPVWSSYVCVDDADDLVARATKAGGKAVMPVMQVMDQGRMAFIQDPTGAALGIWQPLAHQGAGWVNDVGGFCWNELYTFDVDASKAFYEKLFGWELSASAASDGEQYWSIKNAGSPNGGMMRIREDWGPVPPNWAVYFTVESWQGALAKAKDLGGKMFLSNHEAPGVGTFVGLQDPQGAHFLAIQLDQLYEG